PAPAEVVVSSQAPIHFYARLKILRTQVAALGARRQRQRPAHPSGIAELVRRVSHVLFRDEVLRDIPPAKVAAQDQLGFQLALLLPPRDGTEADQVILAIVVHYLQQTPVGAIYVLKLQVEHRINPMFP